MRGCREIIFCEETPAVAAAIEDAFGGYRDLHRLPSTMVEQ